MNFPPPSPWKLRATVDPTREYVAFTSAFYLKSLFRAPAFIRRSLKIMKQVDAASGIVGWALGSNIFKLEFYTALRVAGRREPPAFRAGWRPPRLTG